MQNGIEAALEGATSSKGLSRLWDIYNMFLFSLLTFYNSVLLFLPCAKINKSLFIFLKNGQYCKFCEYLIKTKTQNQ